MIYVHSMGRAVRYYPHQPAFGLSNESRVTFSQFHDRVKRLAAALAANGFAASDRLAFLLPNSPEYIELVYACSWLGLTAVPINARLSAPEIDGVLLDAKPRGLVRHSSLPKPAAQLSWQLVLDEQPLDTRNGFCPDPVYDPEAILALIYTSGTTGRPKGVMMSHANILANLDGPQPTKISLTAYREDISLREAALKLGFVSGQQFDSWVHPEEMTHPVRGKP